MTLIEDHIGPDPAFQTSGLYMGKTKPHIGEMQQLYFLKDDAYEPESPVIYARGVATAQVVRGVGSEPTSVSRSSTDSTPTAPSISSGYAVKFDPRVLKVGEIGGFEPRQSTVHLRIDSD